MRENPKLTNAFKASKDSSSEESSESSDSNDSSSSEESNDEEDEEKAMRMKYTDFLKWKKYVKRKEVYSKPKKERHKPRTKNTLPLFLLSFILATALPSLLHFLVQNMSHTSQNIAKEDLVASNAELKAQVEYLAKHVAQLTKLKMSMVQTQDESEDEQEEDARSEVPSPTMRRNNQEKSSSDFKVEMPTFDGKDDPDDFIEWLETIERVFDYTEVPKDKKVKPVALKFRGYASTWWTNTTTKRKREGKAAVKTWTNMRDLLKKKFIPTHYIRENFARLQHLREGNRSVAEYNRDFEELLMRCDLQENGSQSFVRYLIGLNTQIANTVELQTFKSLEELTKLALKVEAQLKKGKSSLSRELTHSSKGVGHDYLTSLCCRRDDALFEGRWTHLVAMDVLLLAINLGWQVRIKGLMRSSLEDSEA
ncbi:unnamed protein product [Cuscuta campestris]|uniref:Retrotransposon gag domain-containing protein n=1 Tax=Cuscuta campestris TaxID=132261 RepID=A0A484M2X1_9ASTE|nr:unnamed protein product [Cuscuta campestris]